MNNTPKVSVIMSVYNGEKYLAEAVESILNQTFSDFEFIIINDASTDKTEEILKSITDTRLVILKNNTSLGLTKSLNLGLNKARGEYIARMDADDISLPNRLELQVNFLDTHKDIVCVGGGTTIIDSNGKEIGYKKPVCDPELIKFYLMLKNQMTHPSVCFRREIIIENGAYNEAFTYAQDYELWSRLLHRGFKISNINEPLIKYRMHDTSITQGSKKEEAYSFALKTTEQNLLHYTEIKPDVFKAFMLSFHRHTILTFKDLIRILKTISSFKKSYIKKENPTQKNIAIIKSYLKKEWLNSTRWYFKNEFPSFYTLLAKIKHKISK